MRYGYILLLLIAKNMLNKLKLAVVGGLTLACCIPQFASAASLSWDDVQVRPLSVLPVDDNSALVFTVNLPSNITPAKLRDKDEGVLRVGYPVIDPSNANKIYFAVSLLNYQEDGKIASTNKVYAFNRLTNKLQRIYREYSVDETEKVLNLDFVFGNKLVIHYQIGDYSPNPCETNFYSNGAYGHAYLNTLRPWTGPKKFTYPASIIKRNAQETAEMCKNI